MNSPQDLEQAGRSDLSESGMLGRTQASIHGFTFTFRRSIMPLRLVSMGSVVTALLGGPIFIGLLTTHSRSPLA
ncbi:MAG: hypothetical protein AB7G68_05710 [Nitrospiraceae bacterium]